MEFRREGWSLGGRDGVLEGWSFGRMEFWRGGVLERWNMRGREYEWGGVQEGGNLLVQYVDDLASVLLSKLLKIYDIQNL